jgi:signal transduction histidine kinase
MTGRALRPVQLSIERQRRFVADAAHELQTPLASVRTDLEVALAHPASTTWDSTARDVLGANERMTTLVRDLLVLARSDGANTLPPRAVELGDVVREELAHVTSTALDASIDDVAVSGRRDDLARVVRNLVDNAVRHAATRVSVTLSSDGSDAVLVVADDGPGVPVAERDRVFERFVRLDEDRGRSTGGTGLGLAIVRELVAAHGGTVTIDGAAGAEFCVRLPRPV